MAIAGLIPLGLSLLTKLPEIWGAVAGLFGAKTPSTITEAGKLAESISSAVAGNQVAPEVMLEMEKVFNAHKERMAELLLEERKTEMAGILGAQATEQAAYKSEDPYVRQTRPKVLRQLTYTVIAYIFFCIFALMFMAQSPKYEAGEIKVVMDVMKEFFLYLGGMYSIAFTGYNVVRSREKIKGCEDAPSTQNGASILGGFVPFLKK